MNAGFGLGRAIFWSSIGAICLFMMAPSLIVIPMSFNTYGGIRFPPDGFSLQWYGEYFSRPEWTRATINSFVVASLTTVFATALGTVTALGLVRGRMPGRQLLTSLILTPLIVPTIVTAVAMYGVLARFNLVGTILGLVFAHTVLALPFVIVNVSAVLQRMDWRIEQAARSLGASSLKAFVLVTLPIIRPGVLAGALFAFITSFDEVVVAIFISGVDAQTLPVRMWSGLRFEINPIVSAASSFLIGLSIIVLGLYTVLQPRAKQ